MQRTPSLSEVINPKQNCHIKINGAGLHLFTSDYKLVLILETRSEFLKQHYSIVLPINSVVLPAILN